MMKNKILFGIMALVMGIFMTACSDDDDYAISTTPLLNENSVVTGSADVTATNATLHGTVSGLDGQASSAYVTGFKYGSSADNLTENVTATGGTSFSASIAGSVNETVYYQAYVTLQGKVTYTGSVSSCILTNAQAITGGYSDLAANSAKLSGSTSLAPSDAKSGIVLSSIGNALDEEGIELVRAGVIIESSSEGESFDVSALGLIPGTTYYYCAYLDLGSGVVYGDIKDFTTPSLTDFDANEEFVDLGLSVKWARYNVGATKESELGGRFGFGDLAGYKTSVDAEYYANSDTYKTTSDVAYYATNKTGMLPTAQEFEELYQGCTHEETEVDGVKGMRFTSKVSGYTDKSIFLPYAGSRAQNDVTGEGTEGYYMTGSANLNNSEYFYGYKINNTINGRATYPVYTAMSVRAVSLAKNVPFDKTKLYQKWYLENNQDGKLHVFKGPFHQYSVNDTWGTITNNEPDFLCVDDNGNRIDWDMELGNGWFGYTAGQDYGYMEFKEDGTFVVSRKDADGNVTETTGTYTVDEAKKTITVDQNVLAADNNWVTQSGTLNILSLTDDQLQISLPSGIYGYAANYYSESKRQADEEILVQINFADPTWGFSKWGETVQRISPDELEGQHTLTVEGSYTAAMVTCIDFVDMLERYPNAIVVIDDIKCDGNSIKFDANKFYYGDLENNGHFRVQMFNIWGNGNVNSKVPESPFSTKTNCDSDDAFSFNEKLEVTYTVITEPIFQPRVIMVSEGWSAQEWSGGQCASMQVKVGTDNKYTVDPTSFDLTYEASGFGGGTIMTFIQMSSLYKYFPATSATLDEAIFDGQSKTFDASKVLVGGDGDDFRITLWNCYWGMTCGFGDANGEVVPALGFNNSAEFKFTVDKVAFSTPTWE